MPDMIFRKMFAPGPDNPYLILSTYDEKEEDSYEMDQLLVQASSYAEGMTHRRGKTNAFESMSNGADTAQRKSSGAQESQPEDEDEMDVLEAAYEVLNLAPEERK